ncbi:transmembrane protein 268 [Podarcis raffonei]|uniref:transmembrane protein 268 n=1 Tax=Podarcis raffonei TaxID=65483 RepID=UPI0023291DA5|nr:transmembrane protein 268 [Podarcis raffonei]
MACWKRQVDMSKEDELPFSVSYCQTQGEEHSDYWKEELHNGQMLMVLTAHESCFSTFFDMNLWVERLKTMGIQVTADQWKKLIQCAVLEPEVRKHLFYNSRAFAISIAVVFYVTLWINLFSTLQIYSVAQPWEISILATAVALVAALIVRLTIHQHQRKLNVSTDMRLAAANEAFMKNKFLVGFTNMPEKQCSVPQLWFVHFDVGPCLQFLADSLAEMKRNEKSALKHNLKELCIVIETPIVPSQEKGLGISSEDSELLPEKKDSHQSALAYREFLQLVPDGAPEVMAQQLLAIFSGCYIRLLVSGQLTEVAARRHVLLNHTPCLCQFVETTVLAKRCSWFKLR